MELTELQKIWQQYDIKLSENYRLNKEILKRLLLTKPEKRMDRIRLIAGFNLILPIVLLCLILLPNVEIRNDVNFYSGMLLFGIVFTLIYYWAVKYYLLTKKLDYTCSITAIRKNTKQLEKYKIRISGLGFVCIPFGMIGVLLMCNIPFLSRGSILIISLIVLVFIGSLFYTFKLSIYQQFKRIDEELKEIEQLERE